MNLLVSCVEGGNVSQENLVAFSRRCSFSAPERTVYKRGISEINVNRELSSNVATEYFTPELRHISVLADRKFGLTLQLPA